MQDPGTVMAAGQAVHTMTTAWDDDGRVEGCLMVVSSIFNEQFSPAGAEDREGSPKLLMSKGLPSLPPSLAGTDCQPSNVKPL